MGYECPVCSSEEADGEHLANHVAFTALVRGGDHEDWLDEHVPDWEERDPASLAAEVTPHAAETETEPSSEPHGHETPAVERTGKADLSGEAADILEEAREMTEQMRSGEVDGDGEADGDGGDDGDGDGVGGADADSESE
ncbi:MAG: DUF5810 domain-containing protein [Halobacterium sp.]